MPPDYERDTHHRYPVLYMHDGQNLFDSSTAFGGNEWRLDDTAEELIERGAIEPLIIVGIYNTGEQRIHEYTPTADAKLGGGKADLYGRMLVEEVRPFIDGTYRTLRGAENTGLGGSSLGGLVTPPPRLEVSTDLRQARHPLAFGLVGQQSDPARD